ncbi:hypothetical protein GCM10020256_56040 [Streptomyces thermocoprophilus]
MQSQDVASRTAAPAPDPVVDVEQAEAALVEHYPRLVRIAYLVLPPGLGRGRRVMAAHAIVQRALPRGRTRTPVIPAQASGRDGDPGYAFVRLRVLRAALEAGGKRRGLPKRAQLPPLLPHVWGAEAVPPLRRRRGTRAGAGAVEADRPGPRGVCAARSGAAARRGRP